MHCMPGRPCYNEAQEGLGINVEDSFHSRVDYQRDVPPEYQHSSYQEEWDGIPREDIEKAAAYVRNSLRRRGERPAVMV